MDITEKAEGFTFWLGNVDYFVLTSRKNKTRGLAEEILAKMGVTAGDSFGGLGSYVDDGKTVIINI